MSNYYHGQWKVICDVCGWRFPSSQILKRWDGLLVCHADYETDHPQKHIRAINDPKPVPSDWIRREPEITYATALCSRSTSQAIPNIGVPGCMTPSLDNSLR
jgi:hypothetical protein